MPAGQSGGHQPTRSMTMANKKLFPDAKALPPKTPKIKGNRWKKAAPALTAAEPTTAAVAPAPAVTTMPAAGASKPKPRAKKSAKPKAPTKEKAGLSMIDAAKKVLAGKGE